MSYSIPPEYVPANEQIAKAAEKTKSKVLVEIDLKSALGGGLRDYGLKKKDGKWLIDGCGAMIGDKKRKIALV